MKVSVCLATYNGEKYIKEQLESILMQLDECDEIIVSDDNSSDNTMSVIEKFNDSRIKIVCNQLGKGVVKNFENAISYSTGDIVFFCDQDDIWRSDKVNRILDVFKNNDKVTCILSNARIIDGEGKDQGRNFFSKPPKLDFCSVFLKNSFLGCTMAFQRKSFSIIPFSKKLPMHDWYIGLRHIIKGKVYFIDDNLIYYRRHGNNVTSGKRSSLYQIIKWRVLLLKELVKIK